MTEPEQNKNFAQENEIEEIIAGEVTDVLALEQTLEELELELAKNEQFRTFLQRQRDARIQIDSFWKKVETQMIEHNVKSVKGDWGSLTVAERINWTYNEDLPAKFYKKVVDTKKLTDTFRLEGKAPKGSAPNYTKYLTKRIKGQEAKQLLKEIK